MRDQLSIADRARLAGRDRFVGRRRELEMLDGLLDGGEPRANVVLVHGPGGIGKTALIRQLLTRAERRSWSWLVVEGRDLREGAAGIVKALDPMRTAERAVIVFESWEQAPVSAAHLRESVLATTPAGWLIVIASRIPPDAGWAEGGWEHVTVDVALDVLSDEDARDVLRAHGVVDDERARALAKWSAGSPLALVLAARSSTWDPAAGVSDQIIEPLVRRLVDHDLDEERIQLLAVMTAIRITTEEVLRAARPELDAREAYEWLRERSYVEPLGEGLALHDLVRKVLESYLSLRLPELVVDVRRVLADDARDRALAAGAPLSHDLAELLDDPAVRWGFGVDESGQVRLEPAGPGDAAAIEARLSEAARRGPWPGTRKYFELARSHVFVARAVDGTIHGFCVIATSEDEPPIADDPVLPKWLAHARANAASGASVLWRNSNAIDSHDDVYALLGLGGVVAAGVPSPRYVYLPIDPKDDAATAFSAAIGAQRVPELDIELPWQTLECHVADLGPGGIVAAQHREVYRRLGLPAPALPEGPVSADVVRAALRDWHRDDRLRSSPLVTAPPSASAAERADSVRRRIVDAMEAAFGDRPADALLRDAVRLGYLERTGNHDRVAARLHVSRAAYFRTLRDAVERIAAHVR